MYKQIIIARKDLNMSPGKLAAQVSHGSMAFLTTAIRENVFLTRNGILYGCGENIVRGDWYTSTLHFDTDIYDQWINGSFTKCVLQAKNRNQLMKAATIAESLGMREGHEFFLIRDNCWTELEPEDEDGRTLTCIGFKPMDSEIIDKIGRKFHLYV